MAGTVTVAFKRALIEKLRILLAPVQVEYAYPGRDPERECVYAGRSSFSQEPSAMRGGARLRREEHGTLNLHIDVLAPGGGAEMVDAEARASELGELIENYLAANPTLDGLTGLLRAGIEGGDLEQGVDDDAARCHLMLRVSYHSYLT